ncbi:unnamed protein product [Prunus armeniaca]|uniref:Myosin N-terminal SH3-like domain-containing protein n=1 Tax=Prunus armeniaca TaxID=36596 RepID=A0A6J5VHC7_PRUAR|nr:unnamed protein product [Prunus armeniaca]
MSLVVGSLVWLEDPEEAWIDGEVVKVKVEQIEEGLDRNSFLFSFHPLWVGWFSSSNIVAFRNAKDSALFICEELAKIDGQIIDIFRALSNSSLMLVFGFLPIPSTQSYMGLKKLGGRRNLGGGEEIFKGEEIGGEE